MPGPAAEEPAGEPPRRPWRIVLWWVLYAVAAGLLLRWLDGRVIWNW